MAILEKTRFREAMIERMDLMGIGAAELARRTGVSKPQIDKLRQRRTEVTNVYDALVIARFFGQPLEEFMGLTKRSPKHQEIMDIFTALPTELRDVAAAAIKAMAAVRLSQK